MVAKARVELLGNLKKTPISGYCSANTANGRRKVRLALPRSSSLIGVGRECQTGRLQVVGRFAAIAESVVVTHPLGLVGV